MNPRVDVDEEKLSRFCTRHGIQRLALFGSILGEDFGEESDVDVLVSFEPDARVGLIQLAGIKRELSALLGRTVDLVPENSLKPGLKRDILSSAETLYAS